MHMYGIIQISGTEYSARNSLTGEGMHGKKEAGCVSGGEEERGGKMGRKV